MEHVKAAFLFVLGFGMLLVALQGVGRGALPARRTVYRSQQPLLFWFFFLLYLWFSLDVMSHAVTMTFPHGDRPAPPRSRTRWGSDTRTSSSGTHPAISMAWTPLPYPSPWIRPIKESDHTMN